MGTFIRRLLKALLFCIGTITGCVVLYLIMAGLLMLVPVGEKTADTPRHAIYVYSNGAHTDFILPRKNNLCDWGQFIDMNDFPTPASGSRYLAFGFGDKGFYLNTPTWDDLTVNTALKALFLTSPCAIHVNLMWKLPSGKLTRIPVTEEQYLGLVDYIKRSFAQQRPAPIEGAGYHHKDLFFPAQGNYTLFFTCNEWINKGLKKNNIQTAAWSPFDVGIFYHHPPCVSSNCREADELPTSQELSLP